MLERHKSFGNVSAVKSGLGALEYLQSAAVDNCPKPNLIFLDINMPGMNGWEFLDAFNALDNSITAGIKIILLSTSSDPDEVKKSMLQYNVEDFISKPLSLPLLDTIYSTHFNPKVHPM
nr:response regulator [Bacteroidota bacterium]